MRLFELTEALTKLGFCSTFLINSLFVTLTLRYVRNIVGTYKRMLLAFAVACILLSTLEIIAQPFTYNFNEGIIYFSLRPTKDSILPPDLIRWSLIIYAACYVGQITYIAIQFLFRYVILIEHRLAESFRGKKQIFWLIYVFLNGFVYGATLTLCFPLETFSDEYMKQGIRAFYSRDINETPRLIQVMYYTNGSVRWSSIIYAAVSMTILGIQYSIIAFCTFKMHAAMKHELDNMSIKNQQLEKQFFKALTVQIILPTIMLTLPFGLVLLLPLLSLEIELQTGFMFAMISLYPPLDSIATMVIVKEYHWCMKKLIRDVFGCYKKVGNSSMSGNPSHVQHITVTVV